MKLSEVNYGHFVVWSESELVVLRVTLDEDFITTASKRATFFLNMASYTQNHLHPRSLTIPVVEIPVPVTMMMVILLRNVYAISW